MNRVVVSGIVAAAAIGIASCSVTPILDTGKAEGEIEKGILQQAGVAVAVDCPEGIIAKAGEVFECVGTAEDGEKITIKVTQEDDEGNVAWEVVAPK
ncbi:MAG: DUF4333 domain-containing protein [Candidatus Nanopelagicales bacterium]|nr:DUF4333 domain-containing protein [Candidatus Nanopelagicales bacterium]